MSTQTKTRPDPIGMPDQLIDVRPSPQPQPTRPRRFRVTSTGAYFLALFVFVAAVVAWAMTSDVEQSQPATSDSLLHQSVRAREHAQEQIQAGQTQRPSQTVRAIEQAEAQSQLANPGLSVRAIEQAEAQAQSQPANPGLSVRAIEQAEAQAQSQSTNPGLSVRERTDEEVQAEVEGQRLRGEHGAAPSSIEAESQATQQTGSLPDEKLRAHASSEGADTGARPGQSIRALEHSAGQTGSSLDQLGFCEPATSQATPC